PACHSLLSFYLLFRSPPTSPLFPYTTLFRSLALRHQLLVLQRSSRLHKLRLYWADRALWVWLSRLWNDWRSAVAPCQTGDRHRLASQGISPRWRWKSRHLEGRPSVSKTCALQQFTAITYSYEAP